MRRGFTLIELAVVLFILAVAAAVVAPAVAQGMDGIRARGEVAGLAAFLRTARERAITRSVPYEVRVNPEAGLCLLRPVGAPGAQEVRHLWSALRVAADPPGALTVTFYPQGLSSGARFQLQGPGARRYLVSVDPLTGRVTSRLGI